jgi:xylitol oxidase
MSSAKNTDVFASIHFTLGYFPEAAHRIVQELEDVLKPFAARPHWGKLWHTSPSAAAYPHRGAFIETMRRLDPTAKFSRGPFASRALQL